MNTYAIWVDLIDSGQDVELANAVKVFMEHFRRQGMVHSYTLERRKFGFGPDGLGEFHVRIQTETLDQLDQAFMQAATRSGEVENIHREVFSRVKNFRSALYRTFPDEVRV